MGDSVNNERIAKNTVMLYARTLLVMAISLFTSRVILSALGIEDYGINNAVSGVVAMFSIVSNSLSTSISRFLTYEIGRGDINRLKRIFSMSINIQFLISAAILLIGEPLGVWFLNTQMNISPERLNAANWVFQSSLLIMIVGLINVPYNALIIAHEKMSAFAYISILEVFFKLAVAYLLYISLFDKLVEYSILMALVSIMLRLVYGVYCTKHFVEAHYVKVFDCNIFKEMGSFAGWTFLSNGSQVLNTQGVSVLINIFFGVTLNAARGVAIQVESAIKRFVNDFTVALYPQITISYAKGNLADMHVLICRGAKFAFFLLLLIATPFVIEAPYVLALWLEEVPEDADVFFRLSMIATGIALLINTGYVGCMATGNPKLYVGIITPIGSMIFVVTFVAFKLGLSVNWAYWSVIIVNSVLLFVKLVVMKRMINFPIQMYFFKVLARVVPVIALMAVIPLTIHYSMEESFMRFLLVTITSIVNCLSVVYLVGLTRNERYFIMKRIRSRISALYKNNNRITIYLN